RFSRDWSSDVCSSDLASSPVTLAHNGFAGHITLQGVECCTDQYAVALSDQGYGGSPSADREKHPFREMRISGIVNKVKTKSANRSEERRVGKERRGWW